MPPEGLHLCLSPPRRSSRRLTSSTFVDLLEPRRLLSGTDATVSVSTPTTHVSDHGVIVLQLTLTGNLTLGASVGLGYTVELDDGTTTDASSVIGDAPAFVNFAPGEDTIDVLLEADVPTEIDGTPTPAALRVLPTHAFVLEAETVLTVMIHDAIDVDAVPAITFLNEGDAVFEPGVLTDEDDDLADDDFYFPFDGYSGDALEDAAAEMQWIEDNAELFNDVWSFTGDAGGGWGEICYNEAEQARKRIEDLWHQETGQNSFRHWGMATVEGVRRSLLDGLTGLPWGSRFHCVTVIYPKGHPGEAFKLDFWQRHNHGSLTGFLDRWDPTASTAPAWNRTFQSLGQQIPFPQHGF